MGREERKNRRGVVTQEADGFQPLIRKIDLLTPESFRKFSTIVLVLTPMMMLWQTSQRMRRLKIMMSIEMII
jgi:hypothetical protein